ncbi:hypothetical protein ANCDUO_15382 [Ancylostoma duodenale]|uniref:Uncharacterized protein n=1 Tax=Ancylostoma duodenale TaxID=51022 RepID=A0A0C2GBX8_9BILA|nr:hypothetical protein ANCDUO_15382 [Ancylostoma duodenale]
MKIFSRKQDENEASVVERSIERDATAYAKLSKIRWAGQVVRLNDNRCARSVRDWTSRNVKRTTGRPPTKVV